MHISSSPTAQRLKRRLRIRKKSWKSYWNPNADLNYKGVIDITDASTVAYRYYYGTGA